MPRMPAAELHAHGAGVDVKLVMDDHQVRRIHAVGVHELLHGASRRVHVALRLGQHQVNIAVRTLGRQRAALRFPVARAHLFSDGVHRVEPGVVPRVRVFIARIPQAHDQVHVDVPRLLANAPKRAYNMGRRCPAQPGSILL